MKRVVVIGKNQTRLMLGEMIKKQGREITTASDTGHAISQIRDFCENTIDGVGLVIAEEGNVGKQVYEMLRNPEARINDSIYKCSDVPFVFLTGNAPEERAPEPNTFYIRKKTPNEGLVDKKAIGKLLNRYIPLDKY